MASDMPPLPKELFTWLRNLFLHEVDSIALTACEIYIICHYQQFNYLALLLTHFFFPSTALLTWAR